MRLSYRPAILDEIVKQSIVEFNYSEETDAEDEAEDEEAPFSAPPGG